MIHAETPTSASVLRLEARAMGRPRWGVAFVIAVAALLALGIPGPLAGAAPQEAGGGELRYRIPLMELTLELLPDGRMEVREEVRFELESGDFAEGFRSIPLPAGVEIGAVRVTSPELEVDSVQLRTRRRTTEITWSFPRRGADATFVLHYELTNALLVDEGRNLIDWDAVGRAWTVPLEEVRIRVRIPDLGFDESRIEVEPREEGVLAPWPDGGWEASFRPGRLPAETSYRVQLRFPERLPGRAPPPPSEPLRALATILLGALLGGLPAALLLFHTHGRTRPVPPGSRAWEEGVRDDAPLPGIAEVAFLSQGALTWTQRVFPALLLALARRKRMAGLEGDGTPTPHTPFEAEFLQAVESAGGWEGFQKEGGRFRSRGWKEMGRILEEDGYIVREGGRARALMILGITLLGLSVLVLILLLRADGFGGAEAFAGFALFLVLGAGLMAAGSRGFVLTDAGVRVRAAHRRRMEALDSELDQALKEDPARASELLVASLEWFLLDPRYGPDWFAGVEKRLEEGGQSLRIPSWLTPGGYAGGRSDENGIPAEGLVPLYLLLFPGTTTASSPGSMTGFSSTGMGASGGFGGGGGGIR